MEEQIIVKTKENKEWLIPLLIIIIICLVAYIIYGILTTDKKDNTNTDSNLIEAKNEINNIYLENYYKNASLENEDIYLEGTFKYVLYDINHLANEVNISIESSIVIPEYSGCVIPQFLTINDTQTTIEAKLISIQPINNTFLVLTLSYCSTNRILIINSAGESVASYDTNNKYKTIIDSEKNIIYYIGLDEEEYSNLHVITITEGTFTETAKIQTNLLKESAI